MFGSEFGSDVGLLPGESHEERQDRLPAGLEEIPPGPYLAAVVSGVDPQRLNGHDAVRLMKAHHRLVSHFEAQKLAAMAEVAFSPPGDAGSPVERDVCEVDYVAAEIGAALTLTRGASESLLNLAVRLADKLPRVRDALSGGLIDLAKVRVFDDLLSHLPEATIDTVLDQVLDAASELTTGQLRARISRLVLEADPDGAQSGFEEGLKNRRVVTHANPDHTASLHILGGHPHDVATARDHIENLARKLKTRSGERTMDQLRTDIALSLLSGKPVGVDLPNTGSSGGSVNITIPAATLAGLSDEPGELEGYGPVFAEIARKTVLANIDGEWTFTGITDNGEPVATGTLSRRPTQAQKRRIRADYPTCVFPGCRHPARTSDIDHRHPHAQGGQTVNRNLGPLHRYHHIVKTKTSWKLERLPNGDHKWTSPLGHIYIRRRGPPD